MKYPTYVRGLNTYIIQAQSVIQYSYIVGVVASLATGLSIAGHASAMLINPVAYCIIVIRPLIYAILFGELWYRSYKNKMEKMLAVQPGSTENDN